MVNLLFGFAGQFGGVAAQRRRVPLLLHHMISNMRPAARGGSRVAIVLKGSPLYSGAGLG